MQISYIACTSLFHFSLFNCKQNTLISEIQSTQLCLFHALSSVLPRNFHMYSDEKETRIEFNAKIKNREKKRTRN